MNHRRLITSALLTLAFSPAALACDSGFEAFKKTVYAKVRRDCVECHDGSKAKAPPFATDNAESSYSQLLSYMNFSKVDESLLVYRAGNNHCGKENCQETSGKEMAKLGEEWFQSGEKICERNGRLFSEDVLIPESLPGADSGFQTVAIDLGSMKPELKGISFQVDIQNYMDKSSVTRGAYRFRSPRFVGGTNSIYVKNMKVLLNGRYDVIYNQFSTIDRTFPFLSTNIMNSTPVLSASTIIVMKDELKNPKLSVSFMEIELRKEDMRCENLATFTSKVEPLLKSNNCASCHNSSGKSVGEGTFDCTVAAQTLCGTASSLIDPKYLMVSPLISIPSQGLYKHPQLTDEQRYEYVAAIRSWLNQ